MQHFIIGTAGHIDHGKTSLIRALTNIECDTHPEERKRGITINPGFAYLKKEDDNFLAFIDVPGHHRFINNMVAGSIGVDFLMLVIAADDGVMPQTNEHLKICSMLGINSGIIVLNKCDLVKEDSIEFCEQEIEEFVSGTFLEGKPIFRTSTITGEGIDCLRGYLMGGDYDIQLRQRSDYFRMSIDRVFNVVGFGAVVTGTIAGGEVKVGDMIRLLPNNIECKVRGIQQHKMAVEGSEQGTRVAIDITGVKKEDIDIGSILSDSDLPYSKVIDAVLSTVETDIKRRFDATMLIGTKKLNVLVRLLNQDENSIIVQIEVEGGWYFVKGDSFILRDSSTNRTIAGGRIVDPLPLVHKKPSKELLMAIPEAYKDLESYVRMKLAEKGLLYNMDFFCKNLLISKEDLTQKLLKMKDIRVISEYLFMETNVILFEKKIVAGLQKFNTANPLSLLGVDYPKIISFLTNSMFCGEKLSNEKAISLVLGMMIDEGKLIKNQSLWQLKGVKADISEEDNKRLEIVRTIFAEKAPMPYTEKELILDLDSYNIDEKNSIYIIRYLLSKKEIIRVGDCIFLLKTIADIKNKMVSYLNTHKEGLRMGEFRELSGLNRKFALVVFEYFEKEKVVYREGDIRYLR